MIYEDKILTPLISQEEAPAEETPAEEGEGEGEEGEGEVE